MKEIITNPRIWLIAASLTAIVLGIISGDVHRVMVKGATICLECVGLG